MKNVVHLTRSLVELATNFSETTHFQVLKHQLPLHRILTTLVGTWEQVVNVVQQITRH